MAESTSVQLLSHEGGARPRVEDTAGSIEILIDELDDVVVPAADLLSDADVATRNTRPYELPLEDALGEAFGDVTRTSAQFTLPVSLDELPDDAYPTEIYFLPLAGPEPEAAARAAGRLPGSRELGAGPDEPTKC